MVTAHVFNFVDLDLCPFVLENNIFKYFDVEKALLLYDFLKSCNCLIF